ncbi:MAG: hypothetical protein KBD05_03130 [Candidatus Pacebacteria bacterium]|nr:hypothetical protein [Candidatus Paceibacterota bacterium]
MNKLAYIGAAALLLTPLATFAAVTSIYDLGALVLTVINDILVPVVFAIAFIVFIWGVFRYFIAGKQDEESREKGKSLMLWGLIGFFVMVSVWGLVNILVGTLDLNTNVPNFPDTPIPTRR